MLAGPLVAGLLGTLLPALGYLPAIGAREIGSTVFREMLAEPGLARAAWLSATTGLIGAGLALAVAMAIMAVFAGSRWWRAIRTATPAFLAVPHAALAIGLVFLIAPSGLLVRFAIALSGIDRTVPPDWLIVNDSNGIALIAGLALREAPFLLFTLIAATHPFETERQFKIARSLGYNAAEVWLSVLLPQLYRRIRLPVLIVIAYGVTNAEIALVLGPTSPPTLTLLILEWFRDPDVARRLIGAAAAAMEIGLVVLCIFLWLVIERILTSWRQKLVNAGRVRPLAVIATWSGRSAAGLVYALGLLAMSVLMLWSVTGRWRFPDPWPDSLSLAAWVRSGDEVSTALGTTLGIGLIASVLALVLAVLAFENRNARRGVPRNLGRKTQNLGIAALYIPLLIPQISFIFGLQIAMIRSGLDGRWAGVILSHLVFVIPYTALILIDPYRKLDPRFARTARSLGHGPWSVFLHVNLPLLARPLAFAWAIGFSVSCAQYLTTLFVGQGRVMTLSLEALALMGGGDRRQTAVMALLLALLPVASFGLAAAIPRLAWPRLYRRQSVRTRPT